MSIEIKTFGLDNFARRFKDQPDIVDRAAQIAINDAARFGETAAARQMMEEVEFTRSYLTGERFGIRKYATKGNLEASLSGRDRGTSLARFRKSAVRFGRQAGVRLKVSARHAAQTLKSAFFVRLKNDNVGLAVRLKPGESLKNSRGAVELGRGVYLLYGPSVNQVFQGVAADVVDDIGDKAQKEFDRQYTRLSK